MFSSLRRMRDDRLSRREQKRIKDVLGQLRYGRSCTQQYGEELVRELLSLVQRQVQRLTSDDLRTLSTLNAEAEVIIGEEDCSGYCNVAPDNANPGPCLHPNGKVPI